MVSVSIKNYIDRFKPCCIVCGKPIYTYDKIRVVETER